jgi:hypothetical protein
VAAQRCDQSRAAAAVAALQAAALAELLQPMLSWEPAARPTAAQLLRHRYFSGLKLPDRDVGAG